MENKHEMFIENKKITSEHSVRLLGIEIDNQLNFDNHISTLCKKAGSQLNTVGKLRKYIGFLEKGYDRSLCIFKFYFQLLSFSVALYLHKIYKQNRVNTKKSFSTAI